LTPIESSATTAGGPGVYEIQIGIFATDSEAANLLDDFQDVLDDTDVPYELSVLRQDDGYSQPCGTSSLRSRYAELARRWQAQSRPRSAGAEDDEGEASGCVREVRVGVVSSRAQAQRLRDALARVLCPGPGSASEGSVPWLVAYRYCEDPRDAGAAAASRGSETGRGNGSGRGEMVCGSGTGPQHGLRPRSTPGQPGAVPADAHPAAGARPCGGHVPNGADGEPVEDRALRQRYSHLLSHVRG
jgi:hypothetical protein